MAAETGNLVVQMIVAVSGTGVLAAIAQAAVSRSKSKTDVEGGRADAAKVLAEGAAVLVEPLQRRVEMLTRQVGEMQDREMQIYELLRDHAEWDMNVAAKLAQAGLNVAAPPPLHLPHPPR